MGLYRSSILDISSIPLYNSDQDEEQPPDPVQRLKNSIAASAGILVVSPRIQLRDSGCPQERPGLGFPSGL